MEPTCLMLFDGFESNSVYWKAKIVKHSAFLFSLTFEQKLILKDNRSQTLERRYFRLSWQPNMGQRLKEIKRFCPSN
jgi:hypothetical protein